jgi:hypothetical protein
VKDFDGLDFWLCAKLKASIHFCFWRRGQNFGNMGQKFFSALKRGFI